MGRAQKMFGAVKTVLYDPTTEATFYYTLGLMNCNKYITALQDAEGGWRLWAQRVSEHSLYFFFDFCLKSKTSLKNTIY